MYALKTFQLYVLIFFYSVFAPFDAENGTMVWAVPLGDGHMHINLIVLQDIGLFARWTGDYFGDYLSLVTCHLPTCLMRRFRL